MADTALFVYGSLRDQGVLRAVIGRLPPPRARRPALARGWRTVFVPGRPWPVLVRRPGAEAPGLALIALPPGVLRRLDAFEGPAYRRTRLRIACAGRTILAEAYLPASPAPAWPRRPWQFEHWQREGRRPMLAALAIARASRSRSRQP